MRKGIIKDAGKKLFAYIKKNDISVQELFKEHKKI